MADPILDKRTGVKITNPDLSQSLWENVPSLVTRTFHVTHSNIQKLKNWSDQTDGRLKQLDEYNANLEDRLAKMADEKVEIRASIQRLADMFKTKSAQQDLQGSKTASCIGRVLDALMVFSYQSGRTFEDCGWTSEEEGLSSPAMPASRRWSILAEDDTTTQLTQLEASSRDLDDHLGCLLKGFSCLKEWRERVDEHKDELQSVTQTLTEGAAAVKQRLLAWRENQQETTRAVDAVSFTLSAAQNAISNLQRSQVGLERVVTNSMSETKADLEGVISNNMNNIATLSTRVEGRVVEVDSAVTNMWTWVQDRVESEYEQVGKLLEKNLNPVNAFLNQLAIKEGGLEAREDRLECRLQELDSRLDVTAAQLGQAEEERCHRDRDVSESLDHLSSSFILQQRGLDDQVSATTRLFQGLKGELDEHVQTMTESLTGTSESLRCAREVELAKVATDLGSLEQKVAKWIHSNPLPLRISEARLFSMEKRLVLESDARLQLEADFGRTPRAVDGQPSPLANAGSQILSPTGLTYQCRAQVTPRGARNARAAGGD